MFKDKSKSWLLVKAFSVITDISVSLQDHQLKGWGDILLSSKLSENLLNANHKAQGYSRSKPRLWLSSHRRLLPRGLPPTCLLEGGENQVYPPWMVPLRASRPGLSVTAAETPRGLPSAGEKVQEWTRVGHAVCQAHVTQAVSSLSSSHQTGRETEAQEVKSGHTASKRQRGRLLTLFCLLQRAWSFG